MTEAVQKLLPLLASLDDRECAQLVGYLLERLPPPHDMDDEAYSRELDRREADIENGTAELISGEEYFRRSQLKRT
jgi:hypothetical protein